MCFSIGSQHRRVVWVPTKTRLESRINLNLKSLTPHFIYGTVYARPYAREDVYHANTMRPILLSQADARPHAREDVAHQQARTHATVSDGRCRSCTHRHSAVSTVPHPFLKHVAPVSVARSALTATLRPSTGTVL